MPFFGFQLWIKLDKDVVKYKKIRFLLIKQGVYLLRATFLPFSLPSIDEEDIQGVIQVLKSGWITTGPKTSEFEKEFGQYVGAPHCCALTSATAGMHLILKALGIGEGDEVITPSMTWVSTVNLITMTGAKPVFADIDPKTLMITKETLKPLITQKTKAIIPVHFAGASVDMDPIYELAGNIPVIEDAAHAIGTEYKGKRIGSRGISIFSFHPIKNMTTAEGGMVCCHDEALMRRIRRLKFHGLEKDAWSRYKEGKQAEVMEPGFKYNLPDIQSSLGLTQLRKINALNEKRGLLFKRYDELLSGMNFLKPIEKPSFDYKHSYHLYIVLLDLEKTGMTRDGFIEMLKKKNIGTGIHFHAAHLHHFYRENMGCKKGMLPHTEWVSERLFSLPLFPGMSEKDPEEVVAAMKECFSEKGVL